MTIITLFIFTLSLKPIFYTNHNYFYSIAVKDSIVYGATNGGVVAYNSLYNSFMVLTNTDRLTTNRQKYIAIDSSDNIWAGSDNGLIQIDKSFNIIRIYPMECLPCTRVNTIYCLKDTILVGTQNGLLVIDTKGTLENFQDDKVLKIYDFQGLSSNNVLTIEVDTFFWIGTDEKITRFTNDFQSYNIYGVENGLLKNYIRKIKIIDSVLYVGTDAGLNRFTGTYFDTLITGYKIIDIEDAGDSLLLALDSLRQIGIFFQGNLSFLNGGIPPLVEVNDIETNNGQWFCATGNSVKSDYFGEGIGIYNFVNQQWELKKDNCIASNHICSIAASESGVFIAHGTRNVDARGVSWLKNDNRWQDLCENTLVPTKFIHRCVVAPDKKIWFALHYTDSLIAISFNPENNTWYYLRQKFRGIDSTVAIWDLKFDLKNNMYLSLAGPSDKIWVYDSALTKAYLLGDRTPGFEVELAIDSSLRVYSTVFDAAGGVLMIDTKGTLFDRADDINLKYGKTDGLLSQFCSGITVDEKNNVYIANEIGVSVLQNNRFEHIENFNSGVIYDVLSDEQGRVWIMADNGIYTYDINYKILKGFLFNELGVNVEFMPVSNEIIQVQGFCYDPFRFCFWLGSENGLLKLEIVKNDTTALDSVIIYPNPVIRGDVIRIKNIPSDASVTVFSISGRKLIEGLRPNSLGEVIWRIPNNISSGLYFALIITNNDKKVCKFAVVK